MSEELQEQQEKREADKKQKNIDKEIKKSKSSNTDTAKSHGEILREQIIEGLKTYDRQLASIFTSSLTAGMEIGFSYLLMGATFSFFSDYFTEDVLFKIISLVYPLGFIMVIFGQSILFTEQTSLLTLPVLNNKRSTGSLLRLWGTVIAGNLIGGYIIALVLIWIGPRLHLFDAHIMGSIAKHVTEFPPFVIFVSAILAGWMMGLLSWLVTSSRDTITRFMIIFIITATMAFTGLHHSIIGSIEVFSGYIASPDVSLGDYLSFESIALLGNAVGGVVFVALFKYRAFVSNVDIYKGMNNKDR
ncbi:Formate/nitrite transporter FocA, FNT family [Pustulibacterium marinum]|uniref:Formate/nitrite transporter FocA, FNT family n=1 Tax=Pustulibacterium marinum TaxID=1224947 RepID=A0A1I7H3E3_9FLAO|nr:formate/nitrite transporter family protein [Pustulibacterium marinum]SFU55181.1 Formate/nitrite transporter FocA, FNT family [Pustulibacterium marinum]